LVNGIPVLMKNIVRSRGFTLVEVLVVIAIVMLLISLLLAVSLRARTQRELALASRQVKDIADAARQYRDELGAWPPDTDGFPGADATKATAAIHRYLGSKVTDTTSGKTYGPYLDIPVVAQKPPSVAKGGITYMSYCDPWGEPYQLDALHVTVDNASGDVLRFGEPYNSAITDDKVKTLEIKVWSKGQDKKQTLGSQALSGKGTGDDEDNITSWSN
jgi:type II secretory pathway pseudopilin PulG